MFKVYFNITFFTFGILSIGYLFIAVFNSIASEIVFIIQFFILLYMEHLKPTIPEGLLHILVYGMLVCNILSL